MAAARRARGGDGRRGGARQLQGALGRREAAERDRLLARAYAAGEIGPPEPIVAREPGSRATALISMMPS